MTKPHVFIQKQISPKHINCKSNSYLRFVFISFCYSHIIFIIAILIDSFMWNDTYHWLFKNCKIAPSCGSYLYALYSVHCIFCIVFYALYHMHCITCVVFYALYNMHCILCILFYALYSWHCIICIVLDSLYSM